MLLDAVPEARSVEAHDVAALLRALLPREIEQQNKILATVEGEGRSLTPIEPLALQRSDDEAAAADLTTTEKRVDPVEALHQLTVPAVVVPQRTNSGTVALIAGLAVLAGVIVLLFASFPTKKAPVDAQFPPAPPLPVPTETTSEAPSSVPVPSASVTVAPPPSSSVPKPKPPVVVVKKKPPSSKPTCHKVGSLDLCE